MEKKGYGTGKRTKRDIGKSLMVINIKQEIIDILQIANRCFMYNPKIGILILGDEMYGKNICSSHSQEFYVSKEDGHFDDYLRVECLFCEHAHNVKISTPTSNAYIIFFISYPPKSIFSSSKLAGGEQHFMLFADGKSTGNSRFSGARGCSHLDGTK